MLKTLTLASVLMLSTLSFAHANGIDRSYARAPLAERAGIGQGIQHNKPFAHKHKHGAHHMGKPCSHRHTAKPRDKTQIEAYRKHQAERRARFEHRMKHDPAFAKKMHERKVHWNKQHRLEPIPAR
jgi:hypothetical protein